ncbi:MAG: lipid-A-disaccharide synthase, partial [Pseudomonadales bacterium]
MQLPAESTLNITLLAGEASGDLLGGALMAELRAAHGAVSFTGIGGTRMQQEGLSSRAPLERLSVMGLFEPLKRLPELLRIRRDITEFCLQTRPDVFIGIDAPDFNLPIERKLRAAGIKTAHYVSPSVWAWRQKRVV